MGAEEVTTGASNDLQQVRNIARRMVAQWGFSKDSLSPTAWEPAESPGMFAGSTAASEETESTIDDEVAKLVDEAYSVCKETLAQNRPLLDATVDALLEKETIDGFELVHHSSIHLPMSIGDIYSAWELKISESPPSKIAMVEHRQSLPQAVPSSICKKKKK